MLVTGKQILDDAHKNGYAVGAFNTVNMEVAQAIIEAAEEEKSPVFTKQHAALFHMPDMSIFQR